MISNVTSTPIGLLTQSSPVQTKATPAEATESFAAYLKSALDGVAAQEQNVHKVNDQFLLGEVDENKVVIASAQAELSLSLTSQVRNKVIEAYQEIMRMQI
jgi:flagellar hook-basal body complex protein FliE